MWDLETIKRMNAKKPHERPEPASVIRYLNPEDNIREDAMQALLAHARYSFSEINWDFEELTSREKALIKNQKILDAIKSMSTMNSGDGL